MLYRFIMLLVLLVLPATALAQNSPQLRWERYDNIVEIRADGSVQVQEQQELIVERGPARGLTRVFETGSRGAIANIRVFADGQLLARRGDITIRDPGTYAGIDDGQQAMIRVNFVDPNADRHNITIQYVINRTLVASNDRATFDWKFFWDNPEAPEIRNGSVVLQLPGAVPAGQIQVSESGAPARLASGGNDLRWDLTQPIQGEQLSVQASFPRNLLTQTAQLRSSGTTRPQVPNTTGNPTTDPSAGVATGLGIGGMVFCLFIIFFLFIAFMIIRTLARSQSRRGYQPQMTNYDQQGPLGTPFDPYARRRRRRYGGWGGGWGGGFFPPVIITPPTQHHNPYDNNPYDNHTAPFDNTPFDSSPGGGGSSWGDSGGGSSSWGDSGGGSSSWGDSGGGGSSWGDSGGGGSSWGGGGDSGGGSSGGGGGSGGGSFD